MEWVPQVALRSVPPPWPTSAWGVFLAFAQAPTGRKSPAAQSVMGPKVGRYHCRLALDIADFGHGRRTDELQDLYCLSIMVFCKEIPII